jgi:hypothetical protein
MAGHTIRLARTLIPMVWVLLWSAADAQACSCAMPGPACSAVKGAGAVFVGRVTKFGGGSVEFEVERAVVGVRPGRITIGNGPGNCGLEFRPAERYVVYAHRMPSSGELTTNMCTRTRPLSDPRARVDLAHFDRLRSGGVGTVVTGTVFDVTADLTRGNRFPRPLAGVVMTASPASGSPRTTRTRADGTYEFTGIPAGSVRISAAVPAEFKPHEPMVAVIQEPDGCAEVDVGVRIDGRVRGQLLDERGRPLSGVALQLADAAAARSQSLYLETLTARTGSDGRFEFRDVGPGRYVIGAGLREPLRAGKLDRRRFYGETRDPATATVVELARAQRIELKPFKLAPVPRDRSFTVVVRAPSGDVAAATKLFLSAATREPIEHHGKPVTLRLAFGAAYTIEATPPAGHRIVQRVVRVERDDSDRTIEFHVEVHRQ